MNCWEKNEKKERVEVIVKQERVEPRLTKNIFAALY